MVHQRRPPAVRTGAEVSGCLTHSIRVLHEAVFVGRRFVHDPGAVIGDAAVLDLARIAHEVEAHLDPAAAQVAQDDLVIVRQHHRVVGRQEPPVQPCPGA